MSTQVLQKENNQRSPELAAERYLRPHYEVSGDEHAYEVRVYLPGVPRDRATVSLDRESLTVEASRRPHAEKGWRPVHREIPAADYRLRLQLNVRIAEDQISAETRDGVLFIRLPVAEEAKPRTIEVR